MARTLNFPAWCPDLAPIGGGSSETVTGVVPRGDGFGPFKSLEDFTSALPANCRGYFFARRSDGSIAVFAGTSTNLYRLSNTDFTWVLVSKALASYSTLVTSDNWQFAQFNDLVIAVQINTVPQSYALASSTEFANLGGSPPQASHVAIINRFVVLTGLLSAPRRVQWSDLDGPTTWTAGVGLSDYQDLPDGGSCLAISGGDAFGCVFQQETIRSLIYAPGSAVTFQITRIAKNDSLFAKYSVITAGDKTFYCSAQGFKVIMPGGTPQPIGKERVDQFFFDDVDSGNLQLVIGAADPKSPRVFWAYKSQQGLAGLFDKMLCFDPTIGEDGRWSLIRQSGEYLAYLAKPGLTLEALDPIAPTPLTITGAANNGSGAIRLTLSALSNADFNVQGQNFVVVYGVVGTTEANGTWPITVVDATHIDLVGSTFTNAYVSGGKIGGSLDALPFSLDSVSTAAIAQLSAINSDHQLSFFAGPNMEAVVETGEQDGEGEMIFVESVRPITDAAAAMISLGYRYTAQEAVTYSAESAIGVDGSCPQLVEARYIRAKLRIPAGETWRYVRGVQPTGAGAGDR